VPLREHWTCHITGMRSTEAALAQAKARQWRKAASRSTEVDKKQGTLNFIPGLKNANPELGMTLPRWQTCDGARMGQTSRMERTMRQQDCMRGGGRSWRRTELTMEQKVAVTLEPLSLAIRLCSGSSRLRLLHHRRVTQVWERRGQSHGTAAIRQHNNSYNCSTTCARLPALFDRCNRVSCLAQKQQQQQLHHHHYHYCCQY
jgi:hypothetical protein